MKETSIIPVAVHSSYLINLASPRAAVYEKSLHALLDELQRSELLEIPYLVIHPGAHLGEGENKGIRKIVEALNMVHERTRGCKVKILLETTAGQGTNLGYRLEHLADIFALTESRERLGVCFDTCHAFASGYDFRSGDSYGRLLNKIDEIIGLDQVKLFHLNDSKTELGSRIDRHEHPGSGFIGLEAFSLLLNDPRFTGIPFLLETPKGVDENGVDMDAVNLNLLKGLINDSI